MNYLNSPLYAPMGSPVYAPKSPRLYKTEQPDYEMYNPVAPNYSDYEREEVENTQVRDKKRFRCPFRREEDGLSCNTHNDSKTEILNHFYKCHFQRICSGNVYEENLNCFYSRCHDTFANHDKLVKHIHKHEGGRESMFYIKYLIDNLEKEKKEALGELNMAYKAEKIKLENGMEECDKKNQMLIEEHSSAINDMEKESKKRESKLKEDLKYYKKKYDESKIKAANDLKSAKETETQMKDLKFEIEKMSEELSTVKKTSEDSQNQMKGKISDLRERNAELQGKFAIQKETSIELSTKLDKSNRKYSDLGPNSESALMKRNARLEKQLELAKKQIKAKEALLRAKDEEIFKIAYDGSDDDSNEPSNCNNTGEYVEEDWEIEYKKYF